MKNQTEKSERAYWQAFSQTGQIADYLRYRQAAENPNPRRRIADSSKYKELY